MALDTDTRIVLAQALGSDYFAKNLYDTINAAAGGAAAAGSAGAIQASDGAAGFADSGIVATAGSITTGAWNGTAVAVAKGGTGSTSASTARTALGLAIGTNVLAPNGVGTALTALSGSQFTSAPVTVTGLKGANAALTSLLAALVTLGFITDSTGT